MNQRKSPMRAISLLAAVGAALLLCAQAHAESCALAIQPASTNWQIANYDPFGDAAAQQGFDVTFINNGKVACQGQVQVELRGERYGLAAVGSERTMAYSLIDADSQVDLTPRAGASAKRVDSRPVSIEPGKREQRRFVLAADPGDLPASGDYSQSVMIIVLDSNGMPLSKYPVTLSMHVAATAVMGLRGSFTPTGGGGLVKLGQLQEGPIDLPLQLYVKSTSAYRVTVSSTNQGRLRLAGTDWAIGYQLSVGSKTMDLNKVDQIQVTRSGAHDDNYHLGVDVREVANKRAGVYSDTLTFTVAAI
jgi:hypothetical protein